MNILSGTDMHELRSYLYGIRWLFLLTAVVFFISAVAGYFVTAGNPDSAELALQELEGLAELIGDLSPIQIMLFIFLNNSIKSLFAILLGVFFGVIPFAFLAYNGYVLGVVVYIYGAEEGLFSILISLLPHGIIELPMVFLSVAIGMHMGAAVFDLVRGRPSDVKQELVRGLSVFFGFVVPLLFIAAFVETFITPVFILYF
jgi:stage II sporulation protein M